MSQEKGWRGAVPIKPRPSAASTVNPSFESGCKRWSLLADWILPQLHSAPCDIIFHPNKWRHGTCLSQQTQGSECETEREREREGGRERNTQREREGKRVERAYKERGREGKWGTDRMREREQRERERERMDWFAVGAPLGSVLVLITTSHDPNPKKSQRDPNPPKNV